MSVEMVEVPLEVTGFLAKVRNKTLSEIPKVFEEVPAGLRPQQEAEKQRRPKDRRHPKRHGGRRGAYATKR